MIRILTCMVTALGLIIATVVSRPSLRLIYNASDSAPKGWYFVTAASELKAGDFIVATLPAAVAAIAAERGYLPTSVPVLKRIEATEGQFVCVRDGVVSIDGQVVGRVLKEDRLRRELSGWEGCRELVGGELFLLNRDSAASFDSRYFGPVDASFVRGRATLLRAS